ncbi:MAG: hypothetical protein UZ22_OP11002000109 [Microgenomates bacterium OLB23]|nr:MAG: hypothetical protein UZ22_OP11002000109 [Microgenomates bacterium OLB23]
MATVSVSIDDFVDTAQAMSRGTTQTFKVTGGTYNDVYARCATLVYLGYTTSLYNSATGEITVTAPR